MIDDIKAVFSKNLNVLMNRMGVNVSDVSEKTGIPYSTVNDWKNGKKMPRGGNLQKLADYFHVNLSDLTSEQKISNIPSNAIPFGKGFTLIPVIGEIACGDPITAEENVEEYIRISNEDLPRGELFYLRAKGNSMEPRIQNNAKVLCRVQSDVENGEIAAVLVNGDTEATLKRVKKQGDIVMLIAENNTYSPYVITKDNPARIIGKALEVTFGLYDN